MKNYSKVGGKVGRPGYRTPSVYRNKKLSATYRNKISRHIRFK